MRNGSAVHDTEVFGPAATIIPYKDEAQAFALVARGGGSLVASVYGDDRAFFARAVAELGPTHGRLLMVEPSIADAHTGHGIVMPQCHHGGPGRAGNGEELGGLYGLRLYHQRLAVQGSSDLLNELAGQGFRACTKTNDHRRKRAVTPATQRKKKRTHKTKRERRQRERPCPRTSLERRPYNAAADFVDANVARGLGGKAGLHRSAAHADLWRIAAADLPLRIRTAGARASSRRIASRC